MDKTMQGAGREIWLDWVRVIACFMVMVVHSTEPFYLGGGALMPPLQGMIIDKGVIGSLPAVNVSFVLPLICFLIIACYGARTLRKQRK